MKKITLSVSYPEERVVALKLYLTQRGVQMEDEMVKAVDSLYARTVPAGVREFIDLRAGIIPPEKMKKPKPSPSAVGGEDQEVNADG